MASLALEPTPMLVEVADLKATGMSWDLVAKELDLEIGTIKAWPRRYPMQWAKVFGKAKKDLQAEHMAESLHQLRQLLRSKDEKIIRDSATRLLQHYTGSSRKSRSKVRRPAKLPKEMEQIATHLGGLDNVELDGLSDRLIEEVTRPHGTPAAVETPASPNESQ